MQKLRNLLRPKVVLSGLFAAVVLTLGFGISQRPVEAGDCSNNAVLPCGYNNPAEFAAKYAANPYGDTQAIYAQFGLTDGNNFAANAKHVTVYKNGQVKLDDGTILVTDALSMGRQPITGNTEPWDITVNGQTRHFWYGSVQANFASDSLDGYALINADDHSLVIAALKDCGNPAWSENAPGYKCQMLTKTQPNQNDNTTFDFVATPYVKNGAAVSRIVYDFGDGKSQTVTSNFAQKVTHKYAPGNFTARATVYFSVNGQEQSDTRQECTKPVEVKPPKPVYNCTELIGKQVDKSRTKFTFTAKGEGKNGAVMQKVVFNYDDGTSETVDATNNSATATHEYAKEGVHTTKADVIFNVGTDKDNPKCVAKTKTTPPTCEENKDLPQCKPCEELKPIPSECQTCTNTPTLPQCEKPKNCENTPTMPQCKELPKTGPEEVIGTILGLSSLTGAGAYYRASRRNLTDKLLK